MLLTIQNEGWYLTDAMQMQGYVAKDRRAPHRREADEELAQMLEEQDINAEEPIKEPELPKEQKASLLMEEILKNDRDFQTVVKASKVLIDINEPLQASEMLADCITFLARRWKDRYGQSVRTCLHRTKFFQKQQ